MNFKIVKRRTVFLPTLLGWIILSCLFSAIVLLWLIDAESFFSLTERQPAEVLVVESWIGHDGFEAAEHEFKQGGYRILVLTGDLDGKPRGPHITGDGGEAEIDLIRAGVPRESIVIALADDSGEHRTFNMAFAADKALTDANLHPSSINVLTRGTHARRSRLVFAKAFGAKTRVGVISWLPYWMQTSGFWWRSPVRTWFVMKETVGYFFEVVFNSGR
jgi:uncharacterized SAM-binding protein YcdF (DUF218 family)